MPISPADWLAVAALVLVLGVSAVGTSLLWSRGRARRRAGLPPAGSYPGSRRHAGDLNLAWWRSLPAEHARINALFRP